MAPFSQKRTRRPSRLLPFRVHLVDGFLFAACLFAGLFLVLALLAGDRIVDIMHLQRIQKVRAILNQEVTSTLERLEAINEANVIKPLDAAADLPSLEAALRDMSQHFGLPLLGMISREGVMLVRTGSPRRGDYVFQTTPYGRLVAKGESTVSVEAVRNYPLAIMAGVPIKAEDGELLGGFFGGTALDDAYAQAFHSQNMRLGEQLLFYGRASGLYGTSVEDQSLSDLLHANLSRGSEWIQNPTFGIYPLRFRIQEKEYRVGNIPLSSIDQDAGGALVLFPVKSFRLLLTIGIGLILFAVLFFHGKRRHSPNHWTYLFIGSVVLLSSLLCGGFVYVRFFKLPTVVLGPSPFTIYNSTMALVPDSDVFDVTKQQRVAIKIDSGGEALNAAQAMIHYDTQRMTVDDIILTNSFCHPELVFEKTIDRERGIVTVACGVFDGFTGTQSVLAELLFQPLQTGPLEMHFVTGTQVLANDGLGTNVLRSVTNGYYTVAHNTSSTRSLLVFSPTHPNQARWYNKASVHVNWTVPTSSTVSAYAFDGHPETVPDGSQTTRSASVIIPSRTDGIQYFHLKQDESLEGVVHMRVMIDATPPEPPVIQASAVEVKKGEIVRFSFSAEDALSGIQKNFYVSIDGGLWLPSLPYLYIPFLQSGEHEIRVRVFDQAENHRDSSMTIRVR